MELGSKAAPYHRNLRIALPDLWPERKNQRWLNLLPPPIYGDRTAGLIKIIELTVYIDWDSTSKFCTVSGRSSPGSLPPLLSFLSRV